MALCIECNVESRPHHLPSGGTFSLAGQFRGFLNDRDPARRQPTPRPLRFQAKTPRTHPCSRGRRMAATHVWIFSRVEALQDRKRQLKKVLLVRS